ncbi:hybrid sensor histidine kinase/response regulator [Calothrix sp. NIES-3974]|uniref:hybrid sensor histidine kinase/response regulator n=1 Tax=Calothrix sp. NIES-3974 TaxID=2005462 RepID=UPI000B5F9FBC|nr:response regulator [Calothrix sp. NIES-3974]BAZ06790.1 multi-sensor signal transduction histidine kinase [Calothrix sp. NIES-3974]
MLSEQQQRILGYFIEEARDHLNTIEQGLLNLQNTLNDPEMINEVFRAAHSIKGGAAMLGLESIQRTSHRLEDCFKVLKENPIQVDQKLESLFLGVSDTLKALLEHLSSPFGLTEEIANTLMSETEPVFGWLHEHLEELVLQQGGKLETDAPRPQPVSPKPTPPQITNEQLQTQVLQTLRDMLQIFKQPATPENRQELKTYCDRLVVSGDKLNLTNWCDLCNAAASAVINPDHTYLHLAKIIITEIKQALELVMAGRDRDIVISPQLAALVEVPEIELLELDADLFDLSAPGENSAKISEAVADETNTSHPEDESSNLTELDLADDNKIDTSSPGEEVSSLTELDFADNQGEVEGFSNHDEVTSLTELDSLAFVEEEQVGETSAEIPFVSEIGEYENVNNVPVDVGLIDTIEDLSQLSGQVNDDELHPVSQDSQENSVATLDLDGPEVGVEELTELDELFKDDTPELEESWDGQTVRDELHGSGDNQDSGDKTDSYIDSEVHDLLQVEDITSIRTRQPVSREEMTVVQLFGDFLDQDFEEEESEDSQLGTAGDTNGSGEIEQIDQIDKTNDHERTVLFPLADSNLTEGLDQSSVNDLENGDINGEENDFLSELDGVSDTQLGSVDTELDSLFELSSDGELTTSSFLDTNADEFEAFWSQELAESTDASSQNTSQNLDGETDDIGKALEASLFAATGDKQLNNSVPEFVNGHDLHHDDLDLNQELVIGLNLNNLDDQGVDDDIFAEFTPVEAVDYHPPESSPNIHAQSPETLEFPPEFTNDSDNFAIQNPATTELDLPELDGGSRDEFTDVSANITNLDNLISNDNDDIFNLDLEIDENPFLGELFAADSDQNDDIFASISPTANLADNFPEELPLTNQDLGENFLTQEFSQPHPSPKETVNTPPDFQRTTELANNIQDSNLNSEFPTRDNEEENQSENQLNSLNTGELSCEPVANNPVPPPLELDNLNQTLDNTENNTDREFAALDDMLKEIPSSTNPATDLQTDSKTADAFAELDALLETKPDTQEHPDTVLNSEFAALEQLLEPAPPPTPSKDTLSDEFSELERMLVDADQLMGSSSIPANVPIPQRTPPRRSVRFEQLMKVPVKHLDDLSNLVGELVVNRNTLEQDQERMRQSLDNLLHQVQQLSDVGARMQELYERSLLEASLLASRSHSFSHRHDTPNHRENPNPTDASGNIPPDSSSDRGFSELEMDRFTPFHILSQEMIELIVRVRESASDIDFVTEENERVARQFRQVTTQLQEGLTRARMVPFSQVTDRVRRGVRDNAIKCGKQVELVIEGQDTLIDKMILEHLTDPLTHMLNNAIAHGIETPAERQAKGKPETGIITVRAFHQGNQTVISVADDGAGIDPEKVKNKALQVGLISPTQAANMSRMEVYDLLFHSGFSTKDQADDLAGRGVGMDVVRTSISEIRGTITTDSRIDQGTSFTIRLPLTLSICKALCCVSDRARIAFPMDGVEDTLDIPAKSIQTGPDNKQFIIWRDSQLPFKPLKELLTLNRQLSRGNVYGGNRDDDMISVVVVRSGNTMLALQVDQVLSEQEIVIKQFEGPAPKPIGVAGATVLGDGRIMAIADVLEIIDIFQGRTSKQSSISWEPPTNNTLENTEGKIDPTVLIVDDSITVRELLSLTFSKAGYRVEQARDGQEAWDKLRSGLPCDIVFCDIEMPRCDGLELLSRIQKEPTLNHLPIAMLTSRGADKHRQMAISLGASGYFTKPYLEEALLEAASRMLKGENLVSGG